MGQFFERLSAGVIILTIILATSSSATSINTDSGANIVSPITAEFFQDLSFGTIAPSLTLSDTVHVRRGANNDSVCGTNLTCFVPGNRARIRIMGVAGAQFTISNPGSTVLTSGTGDTMLVDNFVGGGSGNNTTWGGFGTLNTNGIKRFNIGATLHVGAAQAIGQYTGTYTVNVDYQ